MIFQQTIRGWRGNVPWAPTPATALEALDRQPEGLSKGDFISINEQSGCDEKNEELKEFLEMSWHWKRKAYNTGS